MARAGALVAETLALVGERLEPGISMLELDRIADEHIASRGGHPTSKGYKGFPAALCLSPNAMVVHGIPTAYRAAGGRHDLGRPRRHARRARRRQRRARSRVGEIDAGGAAAARRLPGGARGRHRAGARRATGFRDISHAVQAVVEGAGFAVVRSLVGHGVGRSLPRGPADPELRPSGPRPAAPGGDDARDRADDHGRRARTSTSTTTTWSISSVDGSLAAHFEHTVAITEEGPRILTPGGALPKACFATMSGPRRGGQLAHAPCRQRVS